jgi:dihydroneopterin aldolase/2-amino-4-hydroxy-6-hydroxymethyldihydropteridine diphosphokinase
VSDEPVVDDQGRRLDRIAVTGIGATGHHGVHQFERDEGQPFVADVVLHLDTRRAAAGDDLTRTVDYGVVARRVHAVLAGEPVALIETVAERIAATVLANPAVHTVDVTVHKPEAPIEVPFDDVRVSIRRDRAKLPAAEPYREAEATIGVAPDEAVDAAADAGEVVEGEIVLDQLDERPGAPVDVVLAIGGNLGPVAETLRAAVHELTRVPGLEVTAVSPLARTAAVGGPDQPDFLNAVVLARTTLAPRELLRACQGIENAHGRERDVRWGPRTLDIDVIVYGSVLAVTDDLELPHPRAYQRAFVLQPWAQADPEAVLPGLGGGPVAVLADTAPDRDGVRWLALDWLTDPIPTTGATPAGGRTGSHAAGHTAPLEAGPIRRAMPVHPTAQVVPVRPAGPTGTAATPVVGPWEP